MSSKAFGKDKRLLSAIDFQRVFDRTQFRVSERYFLFLAIQNPTDNARLGLVVGKKAVRHSVQRNRVKRLVRESFRIQRQTIPAVDIIFLARGGLDKIPGPEFSRSLDNALRLLTAQVGKG